MIYLFLLSRFIADRHYGRHYGRIVAPPSQSRVQPVVYVAHRSMTMASPTSDDSPARCSGSLLPKPLSIPSRCCAARGQREEVKSYP